MGSLVRPSDVSGGLMGSVECATFTGQPAIVDWHLGVLVLSISLYILPMWSYSVTRGGN
jgi:hypothetical protein